MQVNFENREMSTRFRLLVAGYQKTVTGNLKPATSNLKPETCNQIFGIFKSNPIFAVLKNT